ncbi:complex I subunit 5 family protein [Chthonobacter rhizosphaerae]|uniref:complex I subunit 5 family protein n=1 Tax=Chthonobacter rhizosphaerae TaxID=2735553 RepID=UPI0015EEE1E2|nr:proton-conducting transporter membrane subunit [Chthonobacter rhizosphaerae]
MSPLDLLVAAPLAFMVAALVLGQGGRWLILAAGPVMLGLSAWLLALPPDAAHLVGNWDLPLGILLRADGVARLLVPATCVCFVAVALYAWPEFSPKAGRETARAHTFWPMLYLMWGGSNAGYLTTDLFNLYVTIEMVSLAAVALAAMGSLAAGLQYFMIALVGSLAYLLGVALLAGHYDTVDATLLAVRARPDLPTVLALAVMTAGLLVKAALFPLHGWLPPAHAAAPAPASALLSAIVVKLGFVIILRLWFEAFAEVVRPAAIHLLGGMGALAVIYGSIQAIRQERLKPLVAYSTVAQLGYLFLAFPLIWNARIPGEPWAAVLVHAVAHMLAKAAMFLAAGLMLKAVAGDRISDLGGLARAMPLSVTAFALAAISLMGLPPSGGFTAKFLLLHAAIEQGQVIYAGVLVIGGLLGAAYLFRPLSVAFGASAAPVVRAEGALRVAAPLTLAALAIALGFAGMTLIELSSIGAPPAIALPLAEEPGP